MLDDGCLDVVMIYSGMLLPCNVSVLHNLDFQFLFYIDKINMEWGIQQGLVKHLGGTLKMQCNINIKMYKVKSRRSSFQMIAKALCVNACVHRR